MDQIPPGRAIIFIDGECVLCNRFARFVLKHDRKKVFQFATLQGQTAQKSLPPGLSKDLSTVVLYDEAGMHIKSQAIVRIFNRLGRSWSSLTLFRFLSYPFLDGLYHFIASTRYRVFGKYPACRLPTSDEKERLLP